MDQPDIPTIELEIEELYRIAASSSGVDTLGTRLSFYMGMIETLTFTPLYDEPASDQLVLVLLEQKRRWTLAQLVYVMFFPKK